MKNSKKAYDKDGNLKEDFSITLGGVKYGLLTAKGSFTNRNTKNGKVRYNSIMKGRVKAEDYINFYKKTMETHTSKNSKKLKDKKIVLGNIDKKQDKNIKMKVEPKNIKVSLGAIDKRGDQEKPLTKNIQSKLTSDGKSDKGFPYQDLVNKVRNEKGVDFSKEFVLTKKTVKVNSKNVRKRIDSLISSNEILRDVKVIGKDLLKEFYTLLTITRIDKLNKKLEKKYPTKSKSKELDNQNLSAGLVVDFNKLLGGADVNIEALKALFLEKGVIKENIVEQGQPISKTDIKTNTKIKAEDIKQYNEFEGGEEVIKMNNPFRKKPVKRIDDNNYFKKKAVRQNSNYNGKSSMYKNSFKFRIVPKKKDKRKRILL